MKIILTIAIMTTMVAIPAMAEITIQMRNTSDIGYQATVLNSGPDLNGYTLPTGPFATFCVEGYPYPEYFRNGRIYTATIEDAIKYVGASYPAEPGNPNDVLAEPKVATKMLYSAFLNGELASSYDPQNDIWDYEIGDKADVNLTVKGAGAATTGSVQNVLGLSLAQVAGWENVKVLNLWETRDSGNEYHTLEYGYDAQSQLVRVTQVPVPGAFLLGGIGVACIGWIKRRRSL